MINNKIFQCQNTFDILLNNDLANDCESCIKQKLMKNDMRKLQKHTNND